MNHNYTVHIGDFRKFIGNEEACKRYIESVAVESSAHVTSLRIEPPSSPRISDIFQPDDIVVWTRSISDSNFRSERHAYKIILRVSAICEARDVNEDLLEGTVCRAERVDGAPYQPSNEFIFLPAAECRLLDRSIRIQLLMSGTFAVA